LNVKGVPLNNPKSRANSFKSIANQTILHKAAKRSPPFLERDLRSPNPVGGGGLRPVTHLKSSAYL